MDVACFSKDGTKIQKKWKLASQLHLFCSVSEWSSQLHNGAMMSSRGEIMVGEYKLPGLVLKSQEVYNRLYERLRKTWQRRKEVRLTIRD